METLQRAFETRRMKANFIRGTGIPIVCHTPAELPLAIAETYTPSYTKDAIGYFSTCLFSGGKGWEKIYFYPLIESGKSWLAEFPDWRYRVYVPVNFPSENIREMVEAGLEVWRMNRGKEDNAPTLWRFLSAAQKLPVLMMDADWPYTEKAAQNFRLWLASGKKFYWKTTFLGEILWPVTAANWGVRGGLPGWEDKVSRFTDICNCFGCDELFLKKELYPLLISEQTYHVKRPCFYTFWTLLIFFLVIGFGFLLWATTRLAGLVVVQQ